MIRLNEDNLDKVEYCVGCVNQKEQTKLLLSLVKEARDINSILANFP